MQTEGGQMHVANGRRACPGDARGGEQGFTLVELMIAMLMGTLVLAGAYSVLSSSQQANAITEHTVELQQNARVALELLARDFKVAGFGMTTGITGTTCTSPVTPTDQTNGAKDTGPDSVSLIVPSLVGTVVSPGVTGSSTTNTVKLNSGSLAAAITDGFAANAMFSMAGVATYTVGSLASATDTITLLASSFIQAPEVYPVGAQVFWLRCISYSISTNNATCAGGAPCLLRDGVPIADGIEDMQLAYACDGCDGTVADGVVDDIDGSGGFSSCDFLPNTGCAGTVVGTPLPAGATSDSIRMVRISLVARQVRLEQSAEGGGRAQQQAALQVEDHNHADGISAAGDYNATSYVRYRRRLVTRTIQLKNAGLTS
jgi:type IV pilus assembly protein PilW